MKLRKDKKPDITKEETKRNVRPNDIGGPSKSLQRPVTSIPLWSVLDTEVLFEEPFDVHASCRPLIRKKIEKNYNEL